MWTARLVALSLLAIVLGLTPPGAVAQGGTDILQADARNCASLKMAKGRVAHMCLRADVANSAANVGACYPSVSVYTSSSAAKDPAFKIKNLSVTYSKNGGPFTGTPPPRPQAVSLHTKSDKRGFGILSGTVPCGPGDVFQVRFKAILFYKSRSTKFLLTGTENIGG